LLVCLRASPAGVVLRAGTTGSAQELLTATSWMGALMVSPDLIDRALRRILALGQAMRRDAETLPVSAAQSAVLSRLRDGPKALHLT
jgi:hypothetical protein